MQQAPSVVVKTQPVPVGPKSMNVNCPNCAQAIKTRVEHKSTNKTHLMALLLCCCLCWPCACLPYCCDSCQNADHYCPDCKQYLGTYER